MQHTWEYSNENDFAIVCTTCGHETYGLDGAASAPACTGQASA